MKKGWLIVLVLAPFIVATAAIAFILLSGNAGQPPASAPRNPPPPDPAAEQRAAADRSPERGFEIPNTLQWETDKKRTLADLQERFTRHLSTTGKVSAFYQSETVYLDLSLLGLRPDSVAADVGCGTGGLQLHLLEERLPFAKMYAVDTDPTSVSFLRFALETVTLPGREKIVPVLSAFDDVKLPENSIDIMITFNTKIGMRTLDREPSPEKRSEGDRLYESIRRAMKPGALFHVFEPVKYRDRDYPVEYVREPFERHAFALVSTRTLVIDCLTKQISFHYLVFQKTE